MEDLAKNKIYILLFYNIYIFYSFKITRKINQINKTNTYPKGGNNGRELDLIILYFLFLIFCCLNLNLFNYYRKIINKLNNKKIKKYKIIKIAYPKGGNNNRELGFIILILYILYFFIFNLIFSIKNQIIYKKRLHTPRNNGKELDLIIFFFGFLFF